MRAGGRFARLKAISSIFMAGSFARSRFDDHRRGSGDGREWQNRPLEAMYPLIFFDALASKSATRGWCATMSRSALRRMERRTFWACDRNLRRRQILAAGHE